jgi:hypothetical protein
MQKTMAELSVGDRVLVGDNTYSEVYMFSHKDHNAVSTFVSIATSANQTITLSPNHYIYANNKLVAASAVVLGDVLIAADGSEVSVVAVSQERSTGLFNPHTLQGDIVVNGIKASSYTAVVAPTLAHSLLWPVRMLYSLGYDIVNGAFDQGFEALAAIAPRGRKAY